MARGTVALSQGRLYEVKYSDSSLTTISNGVGINLKVGGTDPAQSVGIFFFGRSPPLFGSKSTISRFRERFRDGQYSLVSFLFAAFLLTVPSAQPFVKVGAPAPPVRHGVYYHEYTH